MSLENGSVFKCVLVRTVQIQAPAAAVRLSITLNRVRKTGIILEVRILLYALINVLLSVILGKVCQLLGVEYKKE